MRENKGLFSFAFHSAQVKYGVWTWPNSPPAPLITPRVPTRATGIRHSCEVWNVFMFEFWRIREVLIKEILNDTLEHETRVKWNVFLIEYSRTREVSGYSKRHVPSVLWCSTKHETREKYETCSWSNTEAPESSYLTVVFGSQKYQQAFSERKKLRRL